jgi:DNA mismatch repair protein MSH5
MRSRVNFVRGKSGWLYYYATLPFAAFINTSRLPPLFLFFLQHHNLSTSCFLTMAYKRRRLGPGPGSGSSRAPASSRPQSLSRMSSVPRSIPQSQSSPSLPPNPHQKRLSFRPASSRVVSSRPSSPRAENVPFRAEDYEETDVEIQERENADSMNEVIMAIDMKGGTIGCSYYIAREEKLCMMQDIKYGGLDIVDTLKLHAQPTRILISTRSEEKLEENLSKDARGIDRGDEASTLQLPSLLILG